LISEKATQLAALNKYVFVVPVSANKSEIVKTVKNVYGVSPKKVNSVRNEGKQVRYGRVKGKKSDFKKVIVTLAAGEKIEIYEGV
jgi:large subunit ribosomal protein L23